MTRPLFPKTPAARAARVRTLSQRMRRNAATIEADGDERDDIVEAMRDKDGLTFPQIGDHMGSSHHSAWKAYHRAKGS